MRLQWRYFNSHKNAYKKFAMMLSYTLSAMVFLEWLITTEKLAFES